MKIIFHIGMGKTGTSSIQKALSEAGETLHEQNAHYLGMWFNSMLGADFASHEGLAKLARSSEEASRRLARAYLDHARGVAERTGASVLIHSNEGIFGHVAGFEPFFREIEKEVDLRLVCYVRRPQDWLPSAFTQWNIRHKQQKGPIQSFGQRARTLIQTYDALPAWNRAFPDALQVRLYEKDTDVVSDFSAATGTTLPALSKRFLERAEPIEIVLRAMFNDRFEEPVMPERFNRIVLPTLQSRSLEEMVRLCFEFDGINEIVAERAETFGYIRDALGFDFLSEQAPAPKPVEVEDIRDRLIDVLAELSLSQAVRIKRLERDVAELKGRSEAATP